MKIRSNPIPQVARRPANVPQKPSGASPGPARAEDPAEDDLSVKEGAWVGAVIGLSLGTTAGGYVGKYGAIGGSAYLGYRLGSHFGTLGAIGGALVGGTAAYFEEKHVHVGKTVGGIAGLASGALVGGAVGAIVGVFT